MTQTFLVALGVKSKGQHVQNGIPFQHLGRSDMNDPPNQVTFARAGLAPKLYFVQKTEQTKIRLARGNLQGRFQTCLCEQGCLLSLAWFRAVVVPKKVFPVKRGSYSKAYGWVRSLKDLAARAKSCLRCASLSRNASRCENAQQLWWVYVFEKASRQGCFSRSRVHA